MFVFFVFDQLFLVFQDFYFCDVVVLNFYFCGFEDMKVVWELIGKGILKVEYVVFYFIKLDEFLVMYLVMKCGEILKLMVVF